MKKLIFLPLFAFAFYYPIDFEFKFIYKCMENSNLPNKYEYCKCVLKKLENKFTYQYFLYSSTSPEVLNFLKKASKECLNP